MPKLLVIDDDRAIALLVRQSLDGIAEIQTAETAAEGLAMLRDGDFDAVLLDIMLPDQNGLAVFCEIKEGDNRLPVIFMTVDATSQTAIEAMQLGAFDYLAKPLRSKNLRELVSTALHQRKMSSVPVAIVADESETIEDSEPFIGRSPEMLDVFKAIGRVSKQDIPVLVRGESGTGKELVARALYQFSDRSNEMFTAVNCAALPESLLESELFGHEKGAFTGADARRIGKFEQCDGGTLFLDEIGDMSPVVQAKLLRVLQDQCFERVGGNNELNTDVRIVAATNRPLEEMVGEGLFREDLLYRLNAVTIELPPLRERVADIPLLIQNFLGQAKREFDKEDLTGVSPEAVDVLKSYAWPGNVRQLRAVVRRCVLDAVLPVIVPDVLPDEVKLANEHDSGTGESEQSSERRSQQSESSEPSDGRGLPEVVDRSLSENSENAYSEAIAYAEQYLIVRVLKETNGNQSKAAAILGITRGKLRDRIATYNINLESGVSIGE